MTKRIIALTCLILLGFGLKASVPMNGNYIIGSGGYATFNAAVADLVNNGVDGPCVFKVDQGTYQEQFSIPYIQGVDVNNTITFEAVNPIKNNVKLEMSASQLDNYLIQLDSAYHVSFKGITFRPIHIDYFRCIQIKNGASFINIDGNFFEGKVVSTNTGDEIIGVENSIAKIESINISNNEFSGGRWAVKLSSLTVVERSRGFQIHNNKFSSSRTAAILCDSIENVSVMGNSITISNGTGIQMSHIRGAKILAKNKLDISGANSGIGMHFVSCKTTNNQGDTYVQIYNNIIKMATGSGILLSDVMGVSIYHNTIYASNTGGDYNLNIVNSDTLKIKNNILHNQSSGAIVYFVGTINDKAVGDNVFYGTGAFKYKYGGSTYQNLSDFQTASTDAGSIEHNINFIDQNTFDLKCDVSSVIKMGSKVTWPTLIDEDYWGRSRGTTVWAGASELYVPADNLVDVNGYVRQGTEKITSGTVIAYVDSSQNEMLDKVGEANISSFGYYSFTNIPALPMYLEIHPDNATHPDYLVSYHDGVVRADKSVPFDPDNCSGISIDIFPRKIESMVFDGDGVIKGRLMYNDNGTNKTLSTDPIPGLDVVLDKIPPSKSVAFTQTDANGEYSFSGLPEGVYKVSFDYDGLHADSMYEVTVTAGDTVFNEKDYCIDTLSQIGVCKASEVSVNDVKFSDLKIFPNPFDEIISLNGENEIKRVEVYSIAGTKVFEEQVYANSIDLVLTNQSQGLYVLRVIYDEGYRNIQVVKK